MKRVEQPRELSRQTRAWRAAGERSGLVPTMGALHEGHLSLVRAAREACDRVAVSIFVNPLQFDEPQDLRRYPRPLERDLALLAEAGVDLAYLPREEHLYPPGFETRVAPGVTAAELEGACRPGHFAGVCTVVLKLLAAAGPDAAWFGAKDAQQLAVVRRMAADFDLPLEIVAGPTVRDPDGLALSSRNERLSPAERERALVLSRALFAARTAARAGAAPPAAALAAARQELERGGAGVEVEYLEIRNCLDFRPAGDRLHRAVMVLAARVGGTRLIDNMPLDPAAEALLGGPPERVG